MNHRRAMELLAQAGIHFPAVVPGLGRGGVYIFSAQKVLGHGETIEAALADARERGLVRVLPPRPLFRGDGLTVTRRNEVVATALSRTLADRIANALNVYNPDGRNL